MTGTCLTRRSRTSCAIFDRGSHLPAVALTVWILAALPCGAALTIGVAAGDPDRVEASMADPAAGSYGTRTGTEWPSEIRCDRPDALRSGEGVVQVVSDCGALRWRLSAGSYPTKGIMASDQGAYYAENSSWWLITETAGILRRTGNHAMPRVRLQLNGATVAPLAGPDRLPSLDRAPAFLLLGTVPRVDVGTCRHFFDQSEPPAHLADMLPCCWRCFPCRLASRWRAFPGLLAGT